MTVFNAHTHSHTRTRAHARTHAPTHPPAQTYRRTHTHTFTVYITFPVLCLKNTSILSIHFVTIQITRMLAVDDAYTLTNAIWDTTVYKSLLRHTPLTNARSTHFTPKLYTTYKANWGITLSFYDPVKSEVYAGTAVWLHVCQRSIFPTLTFAMDWSKRGDPRRTDLFTWYQHMEWRTSLTAR